MTKQRVVIENVKPQIEEGRFPVKRVVGDQVSVEADFFCDSHDALTAFLYYRPEERRNWIEVPMEPQFNDRWRACFEVTQLGFYFFTVEAWVDHFKTWRRDLQKKLEADQDVSMDLLIGARLVEEASQRAEEKDREQLLELSQFLRSSNDLKVKIELALDTDLATVVYQYPDRRNSTRLDRELSVIVDREKARFSTWYELFPRSCGQGTEHGTFQDCIQQLSDIAKMGFDVLYLPPIHPIGSTQRKGKNNAPAAQADDCGSPWAIGNEQGGHKSIHPELGTLEDFQELVREAAGHGIEIALDIAFQCSPDHPWVKEHPEWFRQRPDGTIQYAENPPKKYADIYPLNFESEDHEGLWRELKSVFDFWIDQGVLIFRVDNPHTKSFAFWEWAISELRQEHPELILLAEAFTRPKIMYRLGKLGFNQSYTYFAWRNTKWELTQYFHDLTRTEVGDFFRPNVWPNTPDILTEFLQTGGRPAFVIRLLLAATLSSNYGIYGPAFELCLSEPREPGSEEYRDSEKYEIKDWSLDEAEDFRDLIARVNEIRRNNPALQTNETLRFHPTDNDQLICYSKRSVQGGDLIICVANLDPHHTHSGWIELPLQEWRLPEDRPFQAHDLISESHYLWTGPRNFVELDPRVMPGHIFKVRRRVRTERDFEYFL